MININNNIKLYNKMWIYKHNTRVTDIQKDATNVNLVSMLEEDLKVTFKSCRRLDKITIIPLFLELMAKIYLLMVCI